MSLKKPDLHLLVLGVSAVVLFVLGGARVFHASNDFVPVYTGARCLLHGCNPYNTSQLEQQFFAGGGHAAELPSWDIDVPVYPPSTFLVLSPVALLGVSCSPLALVPIELLSIRHRGLDWLYGLSPRSHRWLAAALASYFLATAGILLVLGQPATFAISSVVIASCLFLRKRLLPLGVLLFTLSLAVKPQIGGLIVVYFLVRRIAWRHAAVALAGASALLLSASLILRAHPASEDWPSTLRGNLFATLSPGGSADPRPENQQSTGDINLQTLTSIFFTDASSFNVAAYGVFLALLVARVITG